ncbi:MAG: peptidoglycan DD-metalloendopeptidase family protein [Halioglobus sp.]|nr:peptidoglycan DD-metalloendopeptidase family protein [Halioglobus sp.]
MAAAVALSLFVAIAIAVKPQSDEQADSRDPFAATSSPAEPRAAASSPVAAPALEPTPAAPASTAQPLTAAPPAPMQRPWVEKTVKSGDNLSLIFKRAGYTDRDVFEVVSQARDGKSLARIYPGQVIAFRADDAGELLAVRHTRSALETVTYARGAAGFESAIDTRTPEVRRTWASGTITSSLFMAGQEAGLSQTTIMQLATIFGGVIDFVQDPRKGDTIALLYEDLYLDGEKFGDGEIIAASFTNRGKTYNAFRYVDTSGDAGYYSEEGVSMRKAFLLAPVDFTRISSNFNLRRLHPIYKTTRPHRGTDYAAPRGTPVYAAGDGRVIKAGYSRANGNYVFIRHGEQYVTRYLHLHKRSVKNGQRVSQSQVIGTVGSTGAATGPHLHYEFLLNGVHRDPRKIHKLLPKARTLPAGEMAMFRQAIGEASMQLAALRTDNHLAMSEP